LVLEELPEVKDSVETLEEELVREEHAVNGLEDDVEGAEDELLVEHVPLPLERVVHDVVDCEAREEEQDVRRLVHFRFEAHEDLGVEVEEVQPDPLFDLRSGLLLELL